jgi:hypothetical protein
MKGHGERELNPRQNFDIEMVQHADKENPAPRAIP